MPHQYKSMLAIIAKTDFGKYAMKPNSSSTPPTHLNLSFVDLTPAYLDSLADLLNTPTAELNQLSFSLSRYLTTTPYMWVEKLKVNLLKPMLQALDSDTSFPGAIELKDLSLAKSPLSLKKFVEARDHITELTLAHITIKTINNPETQSGSYIGQHVFENINNSNVNLITSLFNNNWLQKINLENNKLTTDVAVKLMEEIIKHPNISEVNLSSNKIGKGFIEKLLPSLRTLDHKLTISLYNNKADHEEGAITNSVDGNTSVYKGILTYDPHPAALQKVEPAVHADYKSNDYVVPSNEKPHYSTALGVVLDGWGDEDESMS